jgi:glycosyltransferase involved in cell wall biosynthesis
MQIALLSWESMHSIAVGGLAAHVSHLGAALAARGHEVHLFTRRGEKQLTYELLEGVHYHRCPFDPHSDFATYVNRMCDSFVWHLAETEAFLGRPFDVVHGHDWLAVPALVRAKNDHDRPVAFTIHSTEYGRCGNSFRDDGMSKYVRHLEWEGGFVANRVICVSKALSAEAQRCYGIPGDKIEVVYNGVDVARYEARVNARKVRKQYALGADDPFVLFAGRLAWQKGPDILLEALPGLLVEFPRMKVVFAGDGDMRRGLEDRAACAAVNGAPATRFLGHQSGQPLVDLFKSADVVCVPSRNEPFGIVILEAWSAGKPVVATRTGGPAEFVQDFQTGRTVEPNVDDVGRGVRDLLGDRRAARQMGINGRREAKSRFTWDHAAIATEKIYDSLATS